MAVGTMSTALRMTMQVMWLQRHKATAVAASEPPPHATTAVTLRRFT